MKKNIGSSEIVVDKTNNAIINSDKVQVYTGSGSLFPPHALDLEVFNKEVILNLCPYADDLWLTFMAYRNKTKISSLSKWRSFPITIYNTEKTVYGILILKAVRMTSNGLIF